MAVWHLFALQHLCSSFCTYTHHCPSSFFYASISFEVLYLKDRGEKHLRSNTKKNHLSSSYWWVLYRSEEVIFVAIFKQIFCKDTVLTQVNKMALATGQGCLKHLVGLIVKIIIFPPGGHDLEVSLNLAVAHWVIFQLWQLAVCQNIGNYVIIFPGNFHWLLSAFLKVFGYSFNDEGLLSDFETPLFATSIDFLKAFLELI